MPNFRLLNPMWMSNGWSKYGYERSVSHDIILYYFKHFLYFPVQFYQWTLPDINAVRGTNNKEQHFHRILQPSNFLNIGSLCYDLWQPPSRNWICAWKNSKQKEKKSRRTRTTDKNNGNKGQDAWNTPKGKFENWKGEKKLEKQIKTYYWCESHNNDKGMWI